MLEVTKRQDVEFNGKMYKVTWYGDKALVQVQTKSGYRTMNGYGKANKVNMASLVIAKARMEGK